MVGYFFCKRTAAQEIPPVKVSYKMVEFNWKAAYLLKMTG
jgi:hypothetical protein